MRIKQKAARGFATVNDTSPTFVLSELEVVFYDDESKSTVCLSIEDIRAAQKALDTGKQEIDKAREATARAAAALGLD